MDCHRIVSPKLYRFFVFFSSCPYFFCFWFRAVDLSWLYVSLWAHVNYIVWCRVVLSTSKFHYCAPSVSIERQRRLGISYCNPSHFDCLCHCDNLNNAKLRKARYKTKLLYIFASTVLYCRRMVCTTETRRLLLSCRSRDQRNRQSSASRR